jgi:hypothetical protein
MPPLIVLTSRSVNLLDCGWCRGGAVGNEQLLAQYVQLTRKLLAVFRQQLRTRPVLRLCLVKSNRTLDSYS